MNIARELMDERTATLIANNPFRVVPPNGILVGGASSAHARTIANELKIEDAKMAQEVAVLSKRSIVRPSGPTITIRGDTTTYPSAQGKKKGPLTIEIKEVHSTGTFIARKREVGLMRFSLASKQAEIRHLEDEMDRSEKLMRQKQEQLVSTQEKFNNFLKHSNLEQDAAVRRAEVESKAKQERLVDIKKLSAQISHVEQDMRKTEAQLDLCLEYKEFMDNLTTPQWFYNVLLDFRVKDVSKVILAETEETYTRRAQELVKEDEELAERRKQKMDDRNATAERLFSFHRNSNAAASSGGDDQDEEMEEDLPLDAKLAQLYEELEKEAQERQAIAVANLKKEIDAMSVKEMRAILDKEYPQDRIPMFFEEPDQILDIFINVEEGNLFLIQNSQELEEELERVAMDFFNEQADMKSMVEQRHAQMDSLAGRIRETNQRLQQLEERLADIKNADAVATRDVTAPRKTGMPGVKKEKSESTMNQEVLKKRIEATVADIFRCINLHSLSAGRRAAEDSGEESQRPRSAKSPGPRKQQQGTNPATRASKKEAPRLTGAVPASAGGGEGEAGSNMGPVEMLTIIENKLDELHRYIIKPENGVEESLIMNVLKSRDKERRREARMVHLAKQSLDREERNKRALERSQAPVVRRRGKPIMWRSRPPVESLDGAEQKKGPSKTEEADLDEEFFR